MHFDYFRSPKCARSQPCGYSKMERLGPTPRELATDRNPHATAKPRAFGYDLGRCPGHRGPERGAPQTETVTQGRKLVPEMY